MKRRVDLNMHIYIYILCIYSTDKRSVLVGHSPQPLPCYFAIFSTRCPVFTSFAGFPGDFLVLFFPFSRLFVSVGAAAGVYKLHVQLTQYLKDHASVGPMFLDQTSKVERPEKNLRLFRVYMEGYYPLLCGDYKPAIIRSPIKQAGFHGKYRRGFVRSFKWDRLKAG